MRGDLEGLECMFEFCYKLVDFEQTSLLHLKLFCTPLSFSFLYHFREKVSVVNSLIFYKLPSAKKEKGYFYISAFTSMILFHTILGQLAICNSSDYILMYE